MDYDHLDNLFDGCGPYKVEINAIATDEQTPWTFYPNSSTPIEREFDCLNYSTCLGLAAALNWNSFSCSNCCGRVNQQLLWRAHQSVRRDIALAAICKLPRIAAHEGTHPQPQLAPVSPFLKVLG